MAGGDFPLMILKSMMCLRGKGSTRWALGGAQRRSNVFQETTSVSGRGNLSTGRDTRVCMSTEEEKMWGNFSRGEATSP